MVVEESSVSDKARSVSCFGCNLNGASSSLHTGDKTHLRVTHLLCRTSSQLSYESVYTVRVLWLTLAEQLGRLRLLFLLTLLSCDGHIGTYDNVVM